MHLIAFEEDQPCNTNGVFSTHLQFYHFVYLSHPFQRVFFERAGFSIISSVYALLNTIVEVTMIDRLCVLLSFVLLIHWTKRLLC